eukprot:PITA_08964
MPLEDEEPVEGKASPMAGGELLKTMRKPAVLKFLDQQIEMTTREVVGHPNEAGEMAKSEIKLQISRYKEKVGCDIMPMDACHTLLGKPWQYDRKVVHDGLMNCYKFVKDGIKHTLVPIQEEGIAETSEPKILLVSGKQFLKQVEDGEIGYAVIKKARTILLHTEISYLPMKIQQMLEDFTDIVVHDLPDKLPPKRSISHHIDFIPEPS